MPKPSKGPRLGGSPTHERFILRNLASQLFEHGRITTTETKARRLQPVAEKLITKAKRGDLHARRLIMQSITDKDVVRHLFDEIAPSLADREGGYTRITKVGPRKGDNAPMAIIEVVTETLEESREAKKKAGKATGPKAKAAPAETAQAPVEETEEVVEPGASTEPTEPVEATEEVVVEEPATDEAEVVADEEADEAK